ncbi:MAG: alpha-amylase family protein, partial [Cyclobacteriaceae bacterium]|nr:alpha-amylase family protein [Cyclobacteriaceae bacterium]
MKSPQEGKLKSAKEQELIAGNFLSEKCRQEKIVIYQILTRLFGNKKSANIPFGTIDENGVGKFDDINDRALSSLADLGITHIWYTGIIEHAVVSNYRKYGIFPDHPAVVKGRAGSPYAIKDYYDVNPDLANQVEKRMAEFDALIKRTHDHQLRVIIDFVPNHVARKYSSDAKPGGIRDPGQDDDTALGFSPGNNFYYLPDESFKVPAGYTPVGLYHELPGNAGHFIEKPAKVSGNNVFKSQPGIDDWFDTVKLNYGVDYANGERKYFNPIPDTWIKMRDVLLFWTAKNVDGFRCDMAGMVPVEFWEWVIPQVKEKNEHIIFIAEIYKPEQFHAYLNQGKFDFIYDKIHFYDPLKQIVQKKATTPVITESWKSLKGINHNMLRYLENHDEQRIGSSFFAGNAFKALPAMAVISFMSNNPVMIYFGQEVGEPGEGVAGFSGEDGRTTIFDYWGVPSHQKWMNGGKFDGGKLDEQELKLRNSYKQILNICISHPVIREGDFFDLYSYNASLGNITGDQLYYFLRFTENRNLFVIVN